jgi:hypothetical protein
MSDVYNKKERMERKGGIVDKKKKNFFFAQKRVSSTPNVR